MTETAKPPARNHRDRIETASQSNTMTSALLLQTKFRVIRTDVISIASPSNNRRHNSYFTIINNTSSFLIHRLTLWRHHTCFTFTHNDDIVLASGSFELKSSILIQSPTTDVINLISPSHTQLHHQSWVTFSIYDVIILASPSHTMTS